MSYFVLPSHCFLFIRLITSVGEEGLFFSYFCCFCSKAHPIPLGAWEIIIWEAQGVSQ